MTDSIKFIIPQNTFPLEIMDINQWVNWGSRPNKQGVVIAKMPIDPKTGRNAHSNDPATWGSNQDARDGLVRFPGVSGIGFMFSDQDPYCGIDLDKCRDQQTGIVEPWASAIVSDFNSYTEISPSGTGLHVIVRGKLPGNRNRSGKIEMYDKLRYFTMTGIILPGVPLTINDRQEALNRFYDQTFDQKPMPTVTLTRPPSLSDLELFQKIANSAQGAKFARLWQGDTSDYGGDDSAADLALCSILRFWTGGDANRIDALFRQSGLMRQKWGREDYRNRTITAACNAQEFYEPQRSVKSSFTDPVFGHGAVQFPSPLNQIDEWSEPEPLASPELPPVAPMTPEMLPESFRRWLVDISKRMQCPLDFLATGAIVVASSVIGAGCGIRPKVHDDWEVIPNLWGGPVARPSMMKTPALTEVVKILARMEAEEAERFDDLKRFHEAGAEVYKAKREALKSEMSAAAKNKKAARPMDVIQADMASMEPDAEVVRRRFKTHDSTVEKLGELLNQNQRGLLVFRDELTGLLQTWDREDRQSDRAFFLEAWNGNCCFTTDRIGRGTIDIKNTCISILGGMQPGKLQAYLMQAANNLLNDGMVQRFQVLVYPDEPQDWKLIDEKPDRAARDCATVIFKSLAAMDFKQAGAEEVDSERPFFHFNEPGQDLFYEWLTELEGKIRTEENPLLCEHFTKYRSLMPSLALIFHLIDVAGGSNPGPITAHAAAMAADWLDYLETHARRIYSLTGEMGPRAAAALAKKIEQGKLKDGFTPWDVYNKGWSILNTADVVARACEELETAGWLRKEISQPPTGRPKAIYRVNPKMLSKIGEQATS